MLALAGLVCGAFGLAGCGSVRTVAVCTRGTKVSLAVVHGPSRSTLALVPITIDGKGPFTFALDTGASTSAINRQLAQKLGLSVVGRNRSVHGIAGFEHADIVRVQTWKAGGVRLAPSRIASLRLFLGAPKAPSGLLGSDVLSHFSSVCIDYRAETLRLGT